MKSSKARSEDVSSDEANRLLSEPTVTLKEWCERNISNPNNLETDKR
jgi:hypothetical protein